MPDIQGIAIEAAHFDARQRPPSSFYTRVLRAIREHMGMDVAFIARFENGQRHFQEFDAAASGVLIDRDRASPLDETYCQRVIDGRLPQILHDARSNEEALRLPATLQIPIGAHLSVPIRLSNDVVYGTLCCFSTSPNHSLNHRDIGTLNAFAAIVGEQLEMDLALETEQRDAVDRVRDVIAGRKLSTVYQPIMDVARNVIVGFEALSRFHAEPARSPDRWFAEAARAGLGLELEKLAIESALGALPALPPDLYVSVNASPNTIIHGDLRALCEPYPASRIVIELTEHEIVDHYAALIEAVEPLKASGMRLAIDDAGAGYSSFRHILRMEPYMIKLDVSITRHIDADRSRRALAAALCRFAEETGSKLVAEGVETREELSTLREIGFNKAQGYHLGRPLALPQAIERLAAAGR